METPRIQDGVLTDEPLRQEGHRRRKIDRSEGEINGPEGQINWCPVKVFLVASKFVVVEIDEILGGTAVAARVGEESQVWNPHRISHGYCYQG